MSEELTEYATGWVDDQEAVTEVVQGLPWSNFGATDAGAVSFDEIPDHVYGWKDYQEITGQPWPIFNQQNYGTCVSFGTASAMLYTQVGEIKRGDKEQVKVPSMEVVYSGSRVEVGGGRIRGDGSVGAWAAKWVNQWGIVPQGIHGQHDLTKYDGARARKWGAPGAGCPNDLEPVAKQNPVGAVTLVTSFEDACIALSQGFGINVCSNQGFRMSRDSEGFCTAAGSWSHSMAFIGYRKGKRPGLFVVNSWGGNSTTGPAPEGGPASGWWVEAKVADNMLRARDSFAYSKFTGFPKNQSIDWIV